MISSARVLRKAGVLLAVACAGLGWAQTPLGANDPTRLIEEGLRREAQRLQEHEPEPVRDVLRPSSDVTQQAPMIPAESPCFQINSLELQGDSSEHFSWLHKVAAPYLNQCLGVQGLSRLVSALDVELLKTGYATSKVTLPPQNLSQGVLQVRLHAGRIARIEVGEEVRWQGTFPITEGHLLNIRDLEQGVEQMNRLPSRTVQTQLEPGEQADTSVVHILSQANGSRFRGGVTLDNSGTPALGRPQLGVSLALDNPTGLNDLLSASFNTNLKNLRANHRTQSLALNYSIPWGYNLLSVSANTTQFAQQVQLTTSRVTSSGRSHGAEFRWDRVVQRDQSSKLGVFAAASVRRSHSFIDDVELLVQRRRNSFVTLGVNYRHLFSRSSLDAELFARKGVGWFGAEPDYVPAISNGITLRPLIWGANLSWSVARLAAKDADPSAGLPVGFRTGLRLQYTRNATLTVDHFSIGSRGTVRGFDGASALMAESGVAWRNELTLPARFGCLPVVGYLAVDVGHVWGVASKPLAGRTLVGMALGVRMQWHQASFDMALAAPLVKPKEFRTARVSPYLSLSYVF